MVSRLFGTYGVWPNNQLLIQPNIKQYDIQLMKSPLTGRAAGAVLEVTDRNGDHPKNWRAPTRGLKKPREGHKNPRQDNPDLERSSGSYCETSVEAA